MNNYFKTLLSELKDNNENNDENVDDNVDDNVDENVDGRRRNALSLFYPVR